MPKKKNTNSFKYQILRRLRRYKEKLTHWKSKLVTKFSHQAKNGSFTTETNPIAENNTDYYDEKNCKSCRRQLYKYRLFEGDRI